MQKRPLVLYLVAQYAPHSFDDAVQEGTVGLIIGVDRHDPEKGKLGTYAGLWIRQRIRLCLKAPQFISLDEPLADGSDLSPLDLVPDTSPPVLTTLIEDEDVARLRKALSVLPEKERTILELHYGFRGETWTLQAIGDRFNLTRERVRQIRNEALKRLRAAMA